MKPDERMLPAIVKQLLAPEQLGGRESPAVARRITALSQETREDGSGSPIVQPVLAAIPWNWPEVKVGVISSEEWNFSDAMPESNSADVPYTASSSSFSGNYTSFLQMIDKTKFPSPKIIDIALNKVATPTGNVINDASPAGWAKVRNSAGNLEWGLIWSVDSYPDDWIATGPGAQKSYKLIDPDNKAAKSALEEGDTKLEAKAADGKAIRVSPQSLESFSFSFESSGMVTIMPGSWYDSFVVGLASSGEFFKTGVAPTSFFGPNGQLNRRSKGFLIGSNPHLQWNTPGKIDQNLINAASVSAAGVTIESKGGEPIVTATLKGNTVNYAVKPIGTSLYILAVIVELIGAVKRERSTLTRGNISVKNSGAFVSKFSVQYLQSGETRTLESGNFPALVTKTLQLPADVTDILVTVRIATFINIWSVVATYQYDNPVTKSFELTGTTWNPKIKEV